MKSGEERLRRIGRGLGGVLPRSVAALRGSPHWAAASPRGVRQLGEVLFDEVALTGMTLLAPAPVLARPLSGCLPAAEELSGLGIDGAHTAPDGLQVAATRRRPAALGAARPRRAPPRLAALSRP